MKKHCTFLFFLLLIKSVWAQNVPEKPSPARFVNDYAQLLGEGERATLEQKLYNYQDSTSNQMVIVTVPSLEGYDIESYSIALASKWGIGQKGKNNGVLLLVAPAEHKMRIEVGYGLEGVLPDAVCKQIIREVMKPRFKENNFYAGLDQATDHLIKYASGEFKADPKDNKPSVGVGALLFIGFVFLIIIFIFISNFRQARQSHIGSDLSFWTILSILNSMGNNRRGGGGWGGGGSSSSGSNWDFGGGDFGGGGSSGDW